MPTHAMRIRGLGRLKRGARRAVAAFQRRAVILVYHCVAAPARDPHELCVRPQHFAEQLDVIRERYHLLSLRELGRAIDRGEVPHHAVVVTFDDGYADNLHAARPILERREAPATCFVTTGYVGSPRGYWWDELEGLVLVSPALPGCLEVSVAGRCHQWVLGSAARAAAPLTPWTMRSRECPTPRHRAYRELYHLLYPLSGAEREAVLAELRAQAGEGAPGGIERRPMTWEEVRQLDAGDLVEVGAHTVSHPVLAALPLDAQARELRQSKATLEDRLGRPVTTLGYPFGIEEAVGAAAPELARAVGFELACATAPRPVTRGADLYRLPRFYVGDWDGDTFARHLRGFFRS